MMLRQRDSHTKQMTEAPLSPRMAMRKQLREDPSGYLQSGVDEEPPALELFPKPRRPSSSTLFAKLNVEIIQYQVNCLTQFLTTVFFWLEERYSSDCSDIASANDTFGNVFITETSS
jgi:hypothetical protein